MDVRMIDPPGVVETAWRAAPATGEHPGAPIIPLIPCAAIWRSYPQCP